LGYIFGYRPPAGADDKGPAPDRCWASSRWSASC